MIVVLLISSLLGLAVAEIVIRIFGGAWFWKNVRLMRSMLSDFVKIDGDDARQVFLLRTGVVVLKFSISVLLLLGVIAAVATLAPWLLGWGNYHQIVYLVAVSVAATSWWLLRPLILGVSQRQSAEKQESSNSTYGPLERILHWIALEPESVRRLTFELEKAYVRPRSGDLTSRSAGPFAQKIDGPVYVCGLARSGTTTLLRILDQIDTFQSLSYRDMPFVLAPNLWRKVVRHAPKAAVSEERAHGDGIIVDFDSPEGFEEVFWRTFGSRTSDVDCLGSEKPSIETLAAFEDYRALVVNLSERRSHGNHVESRYLSKNNNNLLRLSCLGAERTATVLLVYRDPMATARSLHRQHMHFCSEQTRDAFTLRYMGWLAHHEFGLDHRPFCFALPLMDSALIPEDLNYWLDYWNAVYQYVLTQVGSRVFLFHHDRLRANPAVMLTKLFGILDIDADVSTLSRQVSPPPKCATDCSEFRSDLLERAQMTYQMLMSSRNNIVDL